MTTSTGVVTTEGIYINPHAAKYIHYPQSSTDNPASDPQKIKTFHASLPSFNTTPLHNLPSLAQQLGLKQLLIKSESSRLGLPAFKILGASWGVYRALCQECGVKPDPDVTSLDILKEHVRRLGKQFVLFAATEGNHGRAVAKVARLVLPENEDVAERALIYVPTGMYETTKKLIESEGAKVVTVKGDYDVAVAECWKASEGLKEESKGERIGIMVQDNAFDGYETVPQWIVDGYSTLLAEVEQQFAELEQGSQRHITHIVTPIGVGSLGHAVAKWAKSRQHGIRVIACEPETAACLNASLKAGESTTVEAIRTIMSGMCCGTVSPTSWPELQEAVDASVTVGDWECHESVLELRGNHEIEAGPCGAGCFAGLKRVLASDEARSRLSMDGESVVVMLSTEGKREYPVPERAKYIAD